MATVMIAWELGGGFGHTGMLAPVVSELMKRGHRVVAALRDVSRTHLVWSQLEPILLQAPIRVRPAEDRYEPPSTFAHILHNMGFDDPRSLAALCQAWHSLFDAYEPDLVIFDHSPTAIVASRKYKMKTAVFGTGFCCPADCYPLPDWRPWMENDPALLRRHEDQVCDRINWVLEKSGCAPIQRITQLYSDCHEQLLTTMLELDHFPYRKNANYLGVWTQPCGQRPIWPEGAGPRVFCYLKHFAALPALLHGLNRLEFPTLIFADGISRTVKNHFSSHTLKFAEQPLDLSLVTKETQLAILNGTHGTTLSTLLAGIPIFQVPINLEQFLVAARTRELGAGLIGHYRRPAGLVWAFQEFASKNDFSDNAKRFAQKYSQFDARKSLKEAVTRLLNLLEIN